MERVTGIGGVFIPTKDPGALSGWYEEHLGVTAPPATYDEEPWHQESGPTVFAPLPVDADLGAHPTDRWSINFRVPDLDAMVEQLRAAGVAVDVDPETYPNGRFASLEDPEGNAIQLWQVA